MTPKQVPLSWDCHMYPNVVCSVPAWSRSAFRQFDLLVTVPVPEPPMEDLRSPFRTSVRSLRPGRAAFRSPSWLRRRTRATTSHRTRCGAQQRTARGVAEAKDVDGTRCFPASPCEHLGLWRDPPKRKSWIRVLVHALTCFTRGHRELS